MSVSPVTTLAIRTPEDAKRADEFYSKQNQLATIFSDTIANKTSNDVVKNHPSLASRVGKFLATPFVFIAKKIAAIFNAIIGFFKSSPVSESNGSTASTAAFELLNLMGSTASTGSTGSANKEAIATMFAETEFAEEEAEVAEEEAEVAEAEPTTLGPKSNVRNADISTDNIITGPRTRGARRAASQQ